MNLLARFLFRGSRIHLPVGVLSGGERLRATLACVLYAEPAPQLLLLDEPTNNLDLVSVAPAGGRAQPYEGAFVVVSHDERFLAEIGVQPLAAAVRGTPARNERPWRVRRRCAERRRSGRGRSAHRTAGRPRPRSFRRGCGMECPGPGSGYASRTDERQEEPTGGDH